MTTANPSVDAAEAAWLAALTAPSGDATAALLHKEFVAIHGPTGLIQDRETFLAGLEGRPPTLEATTLQTTRREFTDTVIVSSLQQLSIPFVPDAPPFVVQAAVTRVWVRHDEGWLLGHLQMSRRFPPG
ncbi:nuclear transport factor 2 family protein [Streptomyces sp. NPDC004629]|uniref:nuclear transport factor 2 family protein n=1 Tax=Streptomyces sp. NPDC004629 TaxID=3364705 RepID=UPI00368275CB